MSVILKDTTVWDRKKHILKKLKNLGDFVTNKLNMTGKKDVNNIQAMKEKLRSIDQIEVKKRLIDKNLGKFVLDRYSKVNRSPNHSLEKNKTLSNLPSVFIHK